MEMINKLSVAVTNFSPANAVKKAIANLQAGQYDEAAVQAKLEKYINDNKVRFISRACSVSRLELPHFMP